MDLSCRESWLVQGHDWGFKKFIRRGQCDDMLTFYYKDEGDGDGEDDDYDNGEDDDGDREDNDLHGGGDDGDMEWVSR
eukprot:Em0031g12a